MKQLEYLSDVAYLKKKGGGLSNKLPHKFKPSTTSRVWSSFPGMTLVQKFWFSKRDKQWREITWKKNKRKNKTEVHEGSIAEMWLHQPNDVRLVSINKDVDISGCW